MEPKTKRIDLAASAARVISARHLAAEQARLIESSRGGADHRAIDLMFLLQESVLIFDETHTMLKTLAAREDAIDREAAVVSRRENRASRRVRPLLVTSKVLALIIASAFLIELVDPAPMDVMAFLKPMPGSVESDHH